MRAVKIVAALVVAAVVAGTIVVLLRGSPSNKPVDEPTTPAVVTLEAPLLAPTDLAVKFVRDGVVEATWKAPAGAVPADYEVLRTDPAASGKKIVVTEPKLTLSGLAVNETPCLEISSRRGNAISQSHTPTTCASR